MKNYQRIIDLSERLISSVASRDALCMQENIEVLDNAYREEFGDSIDGFESFRAFALMNLAGARYFAFNNMFSQAHGRFDEMANRMEGFDKLSGYSPEQKAEILKIFRELEQIHNSIPARHKNLVVGRNDSRCCLCRKNPANKTGSHMVPNFLAHPTFSWDGQGKRDREALNHDFLNAGELNCSYYGPEVPEWRFAKGQGKDIVTDEDIENNVNQLEYDNEFCSGCEARFGVLETSYAQFYNGVQKCVNPRVSYLFWLSVLWRMSMGSMSIFMDMNDELSLRKLLDENILGSVQDIIDSEADLGEWKYAIFRIEGMRQGDKGILGYRNESAPYVVSYNDLVMVFYHSNPSDEELSIGPIKVEREDLNDWSKPEKSLVRDRRWFWDVRDWFVETSYDYDDPVREDVLRHIREVERSEGKVISDSDKEEAVEVARLFAGPIQRRIRLRKMERIYGAWIRQKEAQKEGWEYDPLKDEELFLTERDFSMYYSDLATLSRSGEAGRHIKDFPF